MAVGGERGASAAAAGLESGARIVADGMLLLGGVGSYYARQYFTGQDFVFISLLVFFKQ